MQRHTCTRTHTHTHKRARCARGLMTFSEQPTILFVPLECRYVTAAAAASVPQLQSEALATKLPQTMSEREGEREREKERREGGEIE